MRPFSRWSIEWKLPLGGGILLLLVVGVLSSAAYREVHRETAEAARQRLAVLATQLADLLERSGKNAASQLAGIAATPALAAYLADSLRVPRDSAMAALEYHGA